MPNINLGAMSATRNEVLAVILKCIKLLHLYPGKRSLITYVQLMLCTLARCIQCYYAWKLIANNPDSLVIIVNGLRTLSANMQGVKILSFIFHEKELRYILTSMDDFYDTEETEKTYEICRVLAKALHFIFYSSFFLGLCVPLAFGHLPFEADYPVFPYSWWVISGMQLLQILHDVWAVFASDCLFLCLSFFTYTQFKLLNARIELLGVDDRIMHSEAKMCVEHHSFLLRFTQTYSNMFSEAMLVQYFAASISVCIELFGFGKLDVLHTLVGLVFMFLGMVEIFIYCLAADLVVDEATRVNDSISNSTWYNHPKLAKTYVVKILQRAQKTVIFSGLGIVNINKMALTLNFKMIWSLYTLMRNAEYLFD